MVWAYKSYLNGCQTSHSVRTQDQLQTRTAREGFEVKFRLSEYAHKELIVSPKSLAAALRKIFEDVAADWPVLVEQVLLIIGLREHSRSHCANPRPVEVSHPLQNSGEELRQIRTDAQSASQENGPTHRGKEDGIPEDGRTVNDSPKQANSRQWRRNTQRTRQANCLEKARLIEQKLGQKLV